MHNIEDFMDKQGFIHHSIEKDSENGILFSTYYYILISLLNPFNKIKYGNLITNLIEKLETEPDSGQFFMTCNPNDSEDLASHDNLTAIICASKFFNKDFINKIRFSKNYIHPRDIIFFLYIKNNILGKLLLPILSLIMIIQTIPKYKIINNSKYLRTDGLLLSFIRCKTFKLNITYKLMCYLLKKFHKVKNPYSYIFSIYFKDVNHPINIIAKKLEI